MIRKPIPASEGPGSRANGWQRSVQAEMQALRADVSGLVRRLVSPTRPGVPCAYRSSKVFDADRTQSFLVDVLQDGSSSQLCNFVMKDAQTYNIPVRIDAEGVFVAERMGVQFTQRLFDPTLGVGVQYPGSLMSYTMRSASTTGGVFTNNINWTTKFSLMRIPVSPDALALPMQTPAMQFMWNVLDERAGRRYSDFMMPASALGFNAYGVSGLQLSPAVVVDNGLFTFACPWLFERDSNVTFSLLPTSPIIQYDSSISGSAVSPGPGLSFDDREGGIRNQAVTVHVELHGYRYQTSQDAIRAGALTRY